MAHFLIEYQQVGDEKAREDYRADHIAYRKSWGGALALAGPLFDDGGKPAGSIVILEADDAGAARALASGDPYVRNDVFNLVSVRPMRVAYVKAPE